MRQDILEEISRLLMPESPVLLEPLFQQYIATRHGRTRELYECTLRKLRAYMPELSTFGINNVTVGWLHGFDSFLARTAPRRNARNIHLRNLRAVCYTAIDDGMMLRNPFRRFKIRAEPTAKRALTAVQLRRLATAKIEPWQEKYRAAFLLMFMLRGISSVDFCHLTEHDGRYIRYRRRKTGAIMEVRIEPPMLPLLRQLRGCGQLLYPLDRVGDYRQYTAQINAALRSIARSHPFLPAGLTTYWARHTWASVAASLDIPKETIAAALGHGSNTITDVYIDFDQGKIHRANRKVIRYIFQRE